MWVTYVSHQGKSGRSVVLLQWKCNKRGPNLTIFKCSISWLHLSLWDSCSLCHPFLLESMLLLKVLDEPHMNLANLAHFPLASSWWGNILFSTNRPVVNYLGLTFLLNALIILFWQSWPWQNASILFLSMRINCTCLLLIHSASSRPTYWIILKEDILTSAGIIAFVLQPNIYGVAPVDVLTVLRYPSRACGNSHATVGDCLLSFAKSFWCPC